MSHKKAVALSGGGANGAYQAGVLKALCSGASPATGHKLIGAGAYLGTSQRRAAAQAAKGAND